MKKLNQYYKKSMFALVYIFISYKIFKIKILKADEKQDDDLNVYDFDSNIDLIEQ